MSDQLPLPEEKPVTLADLLALAVYDEEDIQSAVDWWDEHASEGWQGALEE